MSKNTRRNALWPDDYTPTPTTEKYPMSRLDPRVAENNRQADRRQAIYNAHHQAVTAWLRENPHIGWLNGGKYYKIVDGETVPVTELGS